MWVVYTGSSWYLLEGHRCIWWGVGVEGAAALGQNSGRLLILFLGSILIRDNVHTDKEKVPISTKDSHYTD